MCWLPRRIFYGATSAITIADLTGTGVQDTAIATLALKRAAQLDLGVAFDSDA